MSAHPLELAPTLTEAEIQGAETFLGVRLPGDYRGFLHHVAAGWMSTGIFPLLRQRMGLGRPAVAPHRYRPATRAFRPIAHRRCPDRSTASAGHSSVDLRVSRA